MGGFFFFFLLFFCVFETKAEMRHCNYHYFAEWTSFGSQCSCSECVPQLCPKPCWHSRVLSIVSVIQCVCFWGHDGNGSVYNGHGFVNDFVILTLVFEPQEVTHCILSMINVCVFVLMNCWWLFSFLSMLIHFFSHPIPSWSSSFSKCSFSHLFFLHFSIFACSPSLSFVIVSACRWSSFCTQLYLSHEILHRFHWACRRHPPDHAKCIWACLLWADRFSTAPPSACPGDPDTSESGSRRKAAVEHREEETSLSGERETDTTCSASQRLGQ